MVNAFVGVLDIEEVLLLWDRVIGFNRLDLLSAVAAAMYMFRKEKLMVARSKKDIQVKQYYNKFFVELNPSSGTRTLLME